MKKIAWISDTTATLSDEFIKNNNINVVPLNIIFGEENYKERFEISEEEFYNKMRNSNVSPMTSQPAIGDFVVLYEKLKEEYEMGFAIHASSSLTGTYSASVQAAEMVGFKLIAIDSKIGSYPLNKMFEVALETYKKTEDLNEVEKEVLKIRDQMELYLLPANLEQLKKSGRLSNGKAILASLLKMNLILTFDDGKVVLSEKIRTERKLREFIMTKLNEVAKTTDEICIIHAGNEELANKWKSEFEKEHKDINFKTMILCPVAGVHLGYDSICFGWIKNK